MKKKKSNNPNGRTPGSFVNVVKKEGTKVMRVPDSLVEQFEQLIKIHKFSPVKLFHQK